MLNHKYFYIGKLEQPLETNCGEQDLTVIVSSIAQFPYAHTVTEIANNRMIDDRRVGEIWSVSGFRNKQSSVTSGSLFPHNATKRCISPAAPRRQVKVSWLTWIRWYGNQLLFIAQVCSRLFIRLLLKTMLSTFKSVCPSSNHHFQREMKCHHKP